MEIWIFFLQDFCHFFRIVMRDCRIHVVSNMSGTNIVMKEIQNWAVRSINSMERSFCPRPFLFIKMRNINVGMLQPCVKDKPEVDSNVG